VGSLRSVIFYKIDRSTQRLTTGRIQYFDIRPARNALELVRSKFNNLIHNSMITLTQRTMHGRRAFDIRFFINAARQGLFFDLTGCFSSLRRR
jgi:hypothetical protein